MKTKTLLLILCTFAFLVNIQAIDHVKGNGKLTTKKISIDDYNSIKIDGVIDFNYVQSDATPKLEITLDENLHQYVDIDIKDRELSIRFKGAKVDHFTKFIVNTNSKWLKKVKTAGNANFMINSALTGDELKIDAYSNCLVQLKKEIEVGKLDIEVTGSANIVSNDIKVDNLECTITGSGTVNLKKGTAKQAKYGITNNGEIMAFGVTSPEVECKMTGSGSMQVHPTDKMKVSIIGKGSIKYKGPASVQQKIIGKGTVEEVK